MDPLLRVSKPLLMSVSDIVLLAVLASVPVGCGRSACAPDRRVAAVRAESGGPLRRVGEIQPAKNGELLFTLVGGSLAQSIDVPLWVELTDYEDEKYLLFHEVDYFELPDGRIYIMEVNNWCGREPECRLLDPATRTFSKPRGGCVPRRGHHSRATPLIWADGTAQRSSADGVWLAVQSDSEGLGSVEVVTYHTERGAKQWLAIGLAADGQVEVRLRSGGLALATNFDLLAKHDTLTVADPPGTPPRRYGWTADSGLRPAAASDPARGR